MSVVLNKMLESEIWSIDEEKGREVAELFLSG